MICNMQVVIFGKGRMSVLAGTIPSKQVSAIVFGVLDEAHEVGEDLLGKEEVKSRDFLRFEFTNTESIDVVIGALKAAKEELQKMKK